jgi:hypothetical protein
MNDLASWLVGSATRNPVLFHFVVDDDDDDDIRVKLNLWIGKNTKAAVLYL